MRIACLQFGPELGKVKENIARADQILANASTENLDLLILPELAFTGYNFPSLSAISPYLEPTASGPTTQWARRTAARLSCIVTVGYPELCTDAISSATILQTIDTAKAPPQICYNSTITVSPTGDILAHYHKTHLYYTDETWASESPTGFLTLPLPLRPCQSPIANSTSATPNHPAADQTILTTLGICMDLNPYRFLAPYSLYEFASHALAQSSSLILCSMAWLTTIPLSSLVCSAKEPDMATLSYWIERLHPLVQQEKETVIVVANRTGVEEGRWRGGEEARYAGTSCVIRVGGGRVGLWGILGRSSEGLLVVDTGVRPRHWVESMGDEDA